MIGIEKVENFEFYFPEYNSNSNWAKDKRR